ncbi:YolD-like family protein [Effusibacillus lacus]|uniref:YolD-like family protein n=1 Tax=Effusibacillus lacus TaxID=1348429 RepID=A0A292YIW1_9BACL|nr:YolD-like family protein [Effusibacillus lacus]TCS71252.1 YolD-like protein [Effusibacillus lacus]GAX89878.1 hypothetical protein EFBL_1503 [Effusibacillus lacus]
MRIIDGNIFEAMRLVLPEHRELMERSKQESKKRKQPILSEDEWSQMGYILGESMQHKHKIRITLFDPHEDVVWEGTPLIKDGKLHLQTYDGIRQVPLKRVVKIEGIK